ncbi:inositol monophosphatase [Halococcus dombrowskii]|uniref:fructose-bisphosphatase n=1 Tax=Halococcus dombrowskii TaxID=179637 RepID=A0AAV3SJ65_HALDO|nr:inositol monophosphatase [Halococcus dombrowskii]UOO96212.1 inositol monophosphatase [Halococcus dombrowskii]
MTETRAERAARAADVGASVALESFRGELAVETKSTKTDLVTETDRAAQRRTIECIHEAFPDDAIVGEEADTRKTVPESGAAWIVDPIDGTNNFVRGLGIWGTVVAAVEDGQTVAAATILPVLGDNYLADEDEATLNGEPIRVSAREDPETFVITPILLGGEFGATVGALAERFGDVRRFGCSQATLAAVAGGSLDAAVATARLSPWDTVAGVHMIRCAGGTVTDLAGERWQHDSDELIASNGEAHEELLVTLRDAAENS